MKRFLSDFMRRGMMAWGFGPLVLAVLYWILHTQGVVDTLTVEQVCTGILSITGLAFLAGGLNPENVTEALAQLRGNLPYAVDVSSGVETDGYKDIRKVREFIEKVRRWRSNAVEEI